MKKITTLILSACFVLMANAQEPSKKSYINPAQTIGTYSFGQYAAIMAREGTRGTDMMDIYTLHFLDDDVKTQEIEVPKGSSLFDVESSANQSVMIFNGSEGVLLALIKPNAAPEYVTVEGQTDYSFGNVYLSDMNDNGDFVLIRSYSKRGKNSKGREVTVESGSEYVNFNALGKLASRRLEATDVEHRFGLVSVFPSNNGMAYLMEVANTRKKLYELKLVICDIAGNLKGEYVLAGEQTFFPSDVINDNGKVVMAGYYLDGNIYTAKKTEGLFVTALDESGAEKSKATFEWDEMKKKLKASKTSDFIFSGRMSVMVEKIEATGSGYTIICESYSSGGGVTGAEFLIGGNSKELVITVHDFVVFETNTTGELVSVNILEKEETNIMMGGTSRSMGQVKMTSMLKKFEVFPFRSYKDGTISFIQYKAKKGVLCEMNSTTGEITEGRNIDLDIIKEERVDKDMEEAVAGSKTLTKLDNMNSKLDRFAAKVDKVGSAVEYGIEKVDMVFSPYGKKDKGLYILSDGRVISYELDQEDFAVYYDFLN
jgi:hypothetical protein